MAPFLSDLVDHKRRVSGHMQEVTHGLLSKIIEHGNLTDYPSDESQATLFDLVDVAISLRVNGNCPFKMSEQVELIVGRTAGVYFFRSHINDVAWWRAVIIEDLFHRAAVHDDSKLGPEEFESYNAAFPGLQRYAYGSPEFEAEKAKIQPAIQHHYKVNDHHPEYFLNGVPEMHLGQVFEMLCDWLAASERSQTGFWAGMDMNKQRFAIDDQLFQILKNTLVKHHGQFRISNSNL